jgi:hypothetical protein
MFWALIATPSYTPRRTGGRPVLAIALHSGRPIPFGLLPTPARLAPFLLDGSMRHSGNMRTLALTQAMLICSTVMLLD